ncbi:hypothetical protein [Myroides sp. WP-1]|uniref:hypothetical protein n=1 Tax=Myroides sp. WP-1 TaxID=2759944 RepID=UPI0015F83066|nr:hypothetical protein [Myroides sp. WP-1]MBB1139114.1 hypothetical protein [Myroides sp. WP-1]
MEYPTTQIIQLIKKELDQQYGNKYIYAVPTWALLQSAPELLFILPVHGESGIAITKQRVDFSVDFSSIPSVLYYAHFLASQMDQNLEIKSYVVFFNKNIIISKDPSYSKKLTKKQEQELISYNDNRIQVDLTVRYFSSTFLPVATLDSQQ